MGKLRLGLSGGSGALTRPALKKPWMPSQLLWHLSTQEVDAGGSGGLRTNQPSTQVPATLLSCLQASLGPVLGETRDSMREFLNATGELMQEVRGPSQSLPWPGSLKGHLTGSLPCFRLQGGKSCVW